MAKNKNTLVALRRLPVLLALGVVFSAGALPTSAKAQNWRIEPSIGVGGEYDDNATLNVRSDEELSLSGLLLGLGADITYSSATTSFSIQPNALLRKYPNESDFDSEDYFVRSEFSHQMQLSTFNIRAFFDQESVRTAERATSDLEVEDPDDLTGDDTGGVLSVGDRRRWRLLPSWDYRFSNISSIGATISHVDVQYEDVFLDLLADYTDTRLDLNYRRSFSTVNTGLLTITGRKYDSAGTSSGDTTGYGVMAGFQYALSQKIQLRAMIGFEDTNASGFDYKPEVTADVTLTRSLETIRMFAQYRRSVNASGAGRLALRDSLNLNFRRRLNEKISAGLGIRAYQSRGIDTSTSFEDRNYVQLQSSFRWYLSAALAIEADYRYTLSDRGIDFGERANSNQVSLWFVYQPNTTPKL